MIQFRASSFASKLSMDADAAVSALVLLASPSVKLQIKKSLIQHSDSQFLSRIVGIVRNVLFGDLEISDSDRVELRRHRVRIHKIAGVQGSEQVKRRYLSQVGTLRVLSGLLQAVLPQLLDTETQSVAPHLSSPPPPAVPDSNNSA